MALFSKSQSISELLTFILLKDFPHHKRTSFHFSQGIVLTKVLFARERRRLIRIHIFQCLCPIFSPCARPTWSDNSWGDSSPSTVILPLLHMLLLVCSWLVQDSSSYPSRHALFMGSSKGGNDDDCRLGEIFCPKEVYSVYLKDDPVLLKNIVVHAKKCCCTVDGEKLRLAI